MQAGEQGNKILVLKNNNTVVESDKKYKIQEGVRKNKKDENVLLVKEIIEPCDEYPKGLIKTSVNKTADIVSWCNFYPEVIGAHFVNANTFYCNYPNCQCPFDKYADEPCLNRRPLRGKVND